MNCARPLAALRGFADMLLVQMARRRGPALADWQQEALEEIELAVARLVKLTEDLLDVTRGQLWFESQEGGGSPFFLGLPAVSDAPLPVQQARRGRRKRLPA